MFVVLFCFLFVFGCVLVFFVFWLFFVCFLVGVLGFLVFLLLRGASDDNCTLIESHSIWESRASFEVWTKSEAIRSAQAQAGAAREIYLGPPQFEGFDAVL